MQVNNKHYRTIWPSDDCSGVYIIDQTLLPHRFEVILLCDLADAVTAIASMQVRGAPLIGATAAYGVALAMRADASDVALESACQQLFASRPTAINLHWALELCRKALEDVPVAARVQVAFELAAKICDDDVQHCEKIGEYGCELIAEIRAAREEKTTVINVMTHCNAGWLATVDWGTALAPIYKAHEAGVNVHVWVSETRPRNQGAFLTAWELAAHGVPYTIIADNAAGHLMQQGMVDLCIVGTDRTTMSGDVCNKIGTYLKALAAKANDIPFYVAAPESSIDWGGVTDSTQIPIEQRNGAELTMSSGLLSTVNQHDEAEEALVDIQVYPSNASVRNDAFDVTPAQLVTGLITEKGVCKASSKGLQFLFPERFA